MKSLSFYHFKDISIMRIFRYALAVMLVLTIAAYSNPANANDVGTVTIQGASIRADYTLDTGRVISPATISSNWNVIYFDQASTNHLVDFKVVLHPVWTATNLTNSSFFTITTNGSGTGFISYDNKQANASEFALYYFFDPGAVFTQSPITITLQKDILTNIVLAPAQTSFCSQNDLSSVKPIGLYSGGGGGCGATRPMTSAVIYSRANVGTTTNNSYNVTYFNNSQAFSIEITKEAIGTKVQLYDDFANIYFTEPNFNTNTTSYFNNSNQGLTLNITTADGGQAILVINHSPSFVNIPTTPGSGGSASGQVYYDYTTATIGSAYGTNASISSANFSALNTYYIYAYDVFGNIVTGSPQSFNTQTYSNGRFWTFNRSGTYTANLSYCGFLDILCTSGITAKTQLDSATIYIPPASYAFSVTTNAANYQPGGTMVITASNPSPNPAYITAFGETGIIDSIAWNTLVPAGGSTSFTRTIPISLPKGAYTINMATTQNYNPIVAQATFNISSPANTSGILSVLWEENLYLLGRVGALTTTTGFNASTLTITSPRGVSISYTYPALSTNSTLVTLNEVGLWKARIVDSGNASNFSQQNTTVTAGNPTDNETIDQCMSAATYVCWDKKQYEQGQAYTINFRQVPRITDLLNPYIEIINPSGTIIYSRTVNGSYDSNANIYTGSISGSFSPQASTGIYFARLKNSNLLGGNETLAESATEVIGRTAAVTATPSIQQNTNNLLSGNFITIILVMLAFAGVGLQLGGFMGSVLGFGSGFIVLSVLGIMPLWALYLFAIMLIVAFAAFVGKTFTGGGND